LLKVVLSVFAPWLTGIARPLVKGDRTALMAVRLRRLRWRLSASLRDAMAEMEM